jgi:hypothetical protein
MKTMIGLVVGLTVLPTTLSAAATEPERSCRQLYRLTDISYAVEPGMLVPATDTTPAHCRVRGVINRAIRVEVTMPVTDWNGRMMFSTVGGGAGMLGDTSSLLARGFAMATTDTGHEIEDLNYLRQPEALIDYAYRGVHLATQFAKKMITRYYGRDIDYAYLKGCSNGGRAAMLEAIRFPDDYDGIIAGAPAFRFQEMTPWMVGAGRMQQANPLTKESLQLLDDASKTACDGLDGIKDGVIDDPRRCTEDLFDIDALACTTGQREGCLTRGQIETARYMYSDVVDANGHVISPGVMPGAEAAGDWTFWMLPNEILSGYDTQSLISEVGRSLEDLKRHDPDFDLDKFDPVADRHTLDDVVSVLDVQTADLTEFHERGGKLLMYQGWNDYPLRPGRALDYLGAVERESGGAEKAAKFFRLFMVPGMLHCAGGPGPWEANYVDPLVEWREKGKAPERIVGTHPAGDVELEHLAPGKDTQESRAYTRPLCPYPKYAKYTGRGDVNDERNFMCVED